MKHLLILLLILSGFHSQAQVIDAELVTIEFTVMEGITFNNFDDPSMNSNGTVIVTGTSNNSLDDFLFVHDSIFFKGTDSTNSTFDFFENQCGIDDFDRVMFMADENGIDGIYRSDLGLIIAEDDPAPGFMAPATINLLYRPHMLPDGTIYFVASVDQDNNGSTDNRSLFMANAITGTVSLVLSSSNNVQGQPLSAFGYDLDFDVNEANSDYIIVADLNTGNTVNDGCVIVNGNIVLQEATTSIGIGENFDNFDFVRINNNGDYLVTGDSDGNFAADEYLSVNGTVHVKEGDILDGYPLTSSATVNGIDMNNNGDVAFIWGTGGLQEYLFMGNINDPNGLSDSKMIIKRNDSIDIDGDFEWDYFITDFNCFTTFRGFELKDTNVLYLNVDLTDTSGINREAIIKIDPFCRPTRNTFAATPCFNDTLLIGTTQVTADGVYYDTTSVSGTCMSIDRHIIDYLPEPTMGHVNAVICAGDSIQLAGSSFSQPGIYYPVLSSVVSGCDSTVEVQIANLPTFDIQESYELCQGDSIYAAGSYQMTDGVYTDTLLSTYFCDSIVSKTVAFVTEFNTPISYSLCQGDSIMVGGAYQFADGVYYDTLSAQFGCDSILVQTISFNTLPTVIVDAYTIDSICADGAAIALPNGLPSGGIYSGNGVTSNLFDPALTGLLGESILYYTYTDSNGCMGSDQTSIIVHDCYLGIDELENRVIIYPNPSANIFHIEFANEVSANYKVLNQLGQVVDAGSASGKKLEIDLSNNAPGQYFLEIGEERFKLIRSN